MTTDQLRGQWSRPAFWLIRGVRPNSPIQTISVSVEQAALGEVGDQGCPCPCRARAGAGCERVSKVLACVSQPPRETSTNVTPCSTSRRAIRQPEPNEPRP